MRRLLWKEWHEQSWKLGFGCIVLGAMAVIGLRARILSDDTMIMWVCFVGVMLLPILSSTGLVPAERGEGSLEMLLALPVKPRKILAAKVIMGVLLCAGPMIVAMVLSLLVAGGREVTGVAMIVFYVSSTLTALFLFGWMMALTIRLPGETRAALLSVGILILWLMATQGLAQSEVPTQAMAVSPFGLVFGVVKGSDSPDSVFAFNSGGAVIWPALGVLAVQAVIAVGLWWYAVRRVVD
jgi:ABC-type transport system involved in multi-copper enzyme maturation permease subunit